MHDIKVAFFLAYKSLIREQKSTVALTTIILSLSFLNLLFMSGILNGYVQSSIQETIDTMTLHIVIDPQENPVQKNFIPDQDMVRSEIQTIPGVLSTVRHYQLAGTIGYDKLKNSKYKYVSAPIYGIDPQQEKQVTIIHKYMKKGTYLDSLRNDEIILGSDLAGGFGGANNTDLGGVHVGDKVQVNYGNGITHTYKVKGIYEIGWTSAYAFISSGEAENILSQTNSASEILVKVDTNKKSINTYIEEIKNLFPLLKIRPYTDLLGTEAQSIYSINIVSFIVTTISIGVSAVTLFVLIYINASNKRKQIGILKAIGIKQRTIIYSYIFQALSYSLAAVIIGMSMVFFLLNPLLQQYPIQLPTGNVSLVYDFIGLISSSSAFLFAGFMAGYIPSSRITKQPILDAIWGA